MNQTSRFSAVSRRAFVKGVGMASLVGLAACSNQDAGLSEETTTPSSTTSTAATTAATTSTGSGTTLPAGALATITFTFATSSSGGMVKNPYIAVWIEDASGNLVNTVSVWHLQGGHDRWLNELSQWYSASGGEATTSGGTRAPGTYSVEWDGTDTSGATVEAGEYIVSIEATREHGSYEIIQQSLTFGNTAFSETLTPADELTAASVDYTV